MSKGFSTWTPPQKHNLSPPLSSPIFPEWLMKEIFYDWNRNEKKSLSPFISKTGGGGEEEGIIWLFISFTFFFNNAWLKQDRNRRRGKRIRWRERVNYDLFSLFPLLSSSGVSFLSPPSLCVCVEKVRGEIAAASTSSAMVLLFSKTYFQTQRGL